MPPSFHPHLAADVGQVILGARTAFGWSQDELSRRSGLSQSMISRLERGRPCRVGLDDLDRLAGAFGGRCRLAFDTPFLADRARQRDRVHARCIAYVATHLRRAGWLVEIEAEIAGSSGPGWIDILARHPVAESMLVIEIKTEIHDFGRIQRTLDWYERGAWAVARGLGGRPRSARSALLVLETAAVDRGLRDNRELAAAAFVGRAADLTLLVNGPHAGSATQRRSLAAIDPRSRRSLWLRPTAIDGRRTSPAYLDYADAARQLSR